jgi:hypothetical protein
LKAKKIELGVLSGVVMGEYQPSERFAAASLHGATKVKLLPTGENINISASTIDGPSSVDLVRDSNILKERKKMTHFFFILAC